jgi:hypothetical protein
MSRKKREVLLCNNLKGQYIGMPGLMYLVHHRGIDVGEASEPEGFSSRSLAMLFNSTIIEIYDDM